jgi:hypothetical protein
LKGVLGKGGTIGEVQSFGDLRYLLNGGRPGGPGFSLSIGAVSSNMSLFGTFKTSAFRAVFLFVCLCHCLSYGSTGIHGIGVAGGRLPLVGTVLSSAILVPPLETAEGVSCSWWTLLALGWSEDPLEALFLEPHFLVSLCSMGPFVKGVRILLFETCVG